MPQVSVIIPTCNRSGFLIRALKSVIGQSFQDLEIIVVDDCGDDDTPAVIESLQKGNIHYFRHDRRRGAAAARNTGILQAKGQYIAFLDDGDEWYPEKLMRQIQEIAASPAEVGGVYTGWFAIDEKSGQIRSQFVPLERGNIHQALLDGNCIGGASAMLMRRACFEHVGLFDERLPIFEEYDLWLRASRQYHFDCVRAPLVKRYVHADKAPAKSEALVRGLELMLGKYGRSPAFRRKCAAYYLGLGVQYCERKQFSAGRKALLRATRLNPLGLEPYAYLALTMLGGQGFSKARQAQASLLPHFRSHHVHSFAESA